MRSEKGVTLTALVIYIAVATVVISTMGLLSSYFYTNMKLIKTDSNYVVEYNKFNMFFVQDVKSNTSADDTTNSIIFEDGTKYKYEDGSIYRNDKEIATNIKSAVFSQEIYQVDWTTKNIITVNLDVGEDEKSYVKQIEYVLRYW